MKLEIERACAAQQAASEQQRIEDNKRNPKYRCPACLGVGRTASPVKVEIERYVSSTAYGQCELLIPAVMDKDDVDELEELFALLIRRKRRLVVTTPLVQVGGAPRE